VAVDGSPFSRNALQETLSLIKHNSGDSKLLVTWVPPMAQAELLPGFVTPSRTDQVESEIQAFTAELRDDCLSMVANHNASSSSAGIDVEFIVGDARVGVRGSLLDTIEAKNVDVLAVGHSGQTNSFMKR
jgi:nucleotide-binding universal stress UspA family protein